MSVQLLIIVLYLVLTIGIGLLVKRRSSSAASFHGTGLGLVMCVAAGTGEWLGGTSTTGVSEYGYLFGLSGAWYTIANGIGVVILAIFFAKLYRSLETVTVPGIIGKYIGGAARTVSSVLLIFVMIAVGTAQVIAAGTLGVSVLGLDYATSVLILGSGFIVYTLSGGMVAVGYTNTMHLVAMYAGVILAIILAGMGMGGASGVAASLPSRSYVNMGSIGFPKVSSWIIASVLGACTAQAGIQPILAARDVNVARKAAFITAALVAPFGLLTAALGMISKVRYPGLTNAKLALPTLLMDMNPVAGGIVLASIMAAILSTVSPIILAAGTMFTKDIYGKLKPEADDRKVLFVSRLSTGIAGGVCVAAALIMYGSTTILDIVYFAYTLRGAIFVVLLLGIYWKRISPKGAIYGMIITAVVGFFWILYKGWVGSYPIAPGFTETYAAVIAALVSTVLFSLVFRSKESALKAGR